MGHTRDAIVAPANPTRPGYTFAGWDINGDGTVDALPQKFEDHSIEAKAVWTPSEVSYTVRYYVYSNKEKTRKRLLASKVYRGKSGVTPTLSDVDALHEVYAYSHLIKADPVKLKFSPIDGSGNSVMQVIYEYKPITVYVLDDDNQKVKDAKVADPLHIIGTFEAYPREQVDLSSYNAAVIARYNKKNNTDAAEILSWGVYLKDRVHYWPGFSFYPPTTGTNAIDYYQINSAGDPLIFVGAYVIHNKKTYSFHIEEIYEGRDGDPDDPESFVFRVSSKGLNYYTSNSNSYYLQKYRIYKGAWDGSSDLDESLWGDWVELAADKLSPANKTIIKMDGLTSNLVQAYMKRRVYKVSYISNSKVVEEKELKYGDSIPEVAAPADVPNPGMVFDGWYTSKSGTTKVSADNIVHMLASDTQLFARWKYPDVHMEFVTGTDELVPTQTIEHGKKASVPTDPARDGYDFAGWYYIDADGVAARFNFDTTLEADTKVYAAWRLKNTPTKYIVRHTTADGTVLLEEVHDGLVGTYVSDSPLSDGDSARAGYDFADAFTRGLTLTSDEANNVINFMYAKQNLHHFTVHFIDITTGEAVATDYSFDKADALLDVYAKKIDGYTLIGSNVGYMLATDADDSAELTFYYKKDPKPAVTPAKIEQAAKPKHLAKAEAKVTVLPKTADLNLPVLPSLAAGAMAVAAALFSKKKPQDGK